MATPPDIQRSNNNVVCEECWEVFLTAIDLEMHRSNCSRITDENKTVEDNLKTSPSSSILKKIEIDNATKSSLGSNDNSEADLTVLKAMPPSEDSVANQNGELLSVFEQSTLVQQSSENMENNLHEFNISLPSQSILGTYIQQQSQHQQSLTIKTHLKDRTDEELKCAQELFQHTQEQELLQHQTSALLTNAILLENGIKSSTTVTTTTTTSTTKTDKSSYKRKLLPKSSRPAEFTQLFQCTQCDSVFYNDASYRDHARSHAKVKEFVCEYCGITLTKYEQMTKHLDKEHNSDLSYYCYLCYTPADDKFSLQEHLKYCGKNEGPKNHVNNSSSNSHLLPNLLSGSTMKYTENLKGLINCPKCGQILGTEEGLNIQDKPVDVQCKYCATIVTLVRQASNIPQQTLPVENKPMDILNQPGSSSSNIQQEPLLIPTAEATQSSTPPQTTSTPLLLYSQSNDSALSQTSSSTPVSLPALTTDTANTTNNLSSVGIPTVAVGSPNHMTLGINTTNGLMVLTVPVVTADKMTTDSVTTPVLQLPTGNLILLGTDVNGGNTIPSIGATSPISNAILQNSLPITSTTSILPTNDILMTATAGINSPSSPEVTYGFPTDTSKELKTKATRYSCPHCGKMFDAQQSWRRHVQTHTAIKKQHKCQLCNKTFSRPGQLRDHMNKIHNSQEESNNNEVHMIKIKT